MSTSLDRIEAAIIDGRARTPRYIQKQLQALYNALLQSLTPIQEAIAQETGYSPTEIWLETNQVLGEVKEQFSKIKLDHFLEQEYSISPDSSTLDKAIAEALTPVMDKDTFAIISQRPQGDILTEEYTIVSGCQDVEVWDSPVATTLKSPSTPTVAIVDRSADILEAARHIVRARFSFRGESHYAPDLALVNEFVVDAFCQAAVKLLTGQLPSVLDANHHKSVPPGPQTSNEGGIQLVSTTRGSIELFPKRDQVPVAQKINVPLLAIHPISSLDDAIDTAQTTASAHNSLLALYIFADLKAAKYLSQFISADLSLTNHIPPQLLVGPAAPLQYPVSISGRYTNEMFSSPSPELVVPTEKDRLWARYLDGQISPQEADKVKAELTKPLGDIGEPEGKATGFFEQGFHLGLGVEVLAITGIFGLAAKYALGHLLAR
ncbi:hypothetical protein DV735_g76, partial [Chaetothyriales sp. CBS 134920]